MLDRKRLKDLCDRGEKADQSLSEGHAREALRAYSQIAKELEKHGEFDSYLAAKVTLGYLRCYVKLGEFKKAYSVWNAHLEESLFGIGIYALESAQTTVTDMITYDMVCAFLHTLGDADKAETASAVNQYMSRVCEYALEQGDRAVMKNALSNWKQHLREIFGSSVPMRHAKLLIQFERSLGETVKPRSIDFPRPSSWEKPRDFLEMSRLSDFRGFKHPSSGRKSRAS